MAWECPPEVRSEGEGVRGQRQLDSTEERRRRGRGGVEEEEGVRKGGGGRAGGEVGCPSGGLTPPNGTLTLN